MPFHSNLLAIVTAMLVAVCLGSDARADGKTVVAEGLAVEIGQTRFQIPRLTAEGTSLTGADIARIFDPKDAASLDDRLARLTAARILIPEIRGESRSGDREARFAYREVSLDSVSAGRVGVMHAAALEQFGSGKDVGRMEAHYSGLAAKGVDLRQFARVVVAPRSDQKETAQALEEEASIESVSLVFPDAGFDIRIGRVSASGLRARALAEPPLRLLERLPAAGMAPTQEQSAELALAAIDALGAVEVGAIEARDLSVVGLSAPANKPYAIKIGLVALNRLVGGSVQEAKVDGFSLDSADGGHIAFQNLSLQGLDLNALIKPGQRRLWKLDHAQLANLTADLPDAASEGRIKFKIGGLAADFANHREGLPTKLSVRLDRFNIDLAARGEVPATAQLTALGYKEVEVSADMKAEWREQTQEIVVDQLHIDSKDMATITLAATLGNATTLVFSASPLMSKAAALAITLTRLEASVEGGGLIDRLLAQEAKSSGGDVAKLRAAYARDVASAISASLDNGEKARRIGEAAAKFIERPKRLHLKLSAPKGVGVLDALLKRPGDILNEVDVAAGAE
jgi:hypothetical protein